jgi:solute carrier family 35 protein F5
VGSNFINKHVLETYPKYFMLSYLTNLSYLLYFIFLLIDDPVNQLMPKLPEEGDQVEAQPVPATSSGSVKIFPKRELPAFTRWQLAKIALVFFPLYLASNYATNMSLERTSVGSFSILAATCGFFTLVIGWLFGVEVLSCLRILAVFISVGGVLILGIPELMARDSQTTGNILALLGAFLYGVYSVYLKRVAIDESRISMPLLFAFGGLYTVLFGWIVLLFLHFWGIETLEFPPNWSIVGWIATSVFVGSLLPNYLWNVAFVLTSPLTVAIGISFTIPLTLAIEIMNGMQPEFHRIASGLLIVIGFVIVNLSNVFPTWDLAAERLLVRLGLLHEEKVQSTEERSLRQRNALIEATAV